MKGFGKYFAKFVSILPYVFVFIASLYIPTDPDLGWHLRNGEYFFQHGQVLRENTFSTMMPDYKWANGHWGTDVITYFAYSIGGFLGLTLIASVIVTATFYFFEKAARLQLTDKALLFPMLVYLVNPINSVSLRGQQISLLMTGVMVFILSRYKSRSSKILLWIPALFLFWANTHMQFLLGIAIFGVWIGVTILQDFIVEKNQRRQAYKKAAYLIIIFLVSFSSTFINPFGSGVFREAIRHFGNPLLKYVAEYLPISLLSHLWWIQVFVGVLAAMGIIFLYFKGRLIGQLPIISAAFILFVFSFFARRYIWTAYYLIIPTLLPLTGFLTPSSKRYKLYFSSAFLVLSLGVIILLKWPFVSYASFTWDKYCISENTLCSPGSAEYLRAHKLTGNLFSLYGWGGWMIWNYPDIKPTIDGRQTIWEKDGISAFGQYYDLEQNVLDIDKSIYNIVYMSPNKPIYKRMAGLVKTGKWKKVYEDKYAGIFVRHKQ